MDIPKLSKHELVAAALDVLAEYNIRMTLRQLYYRLVARQLILNNTSQYKRLSSVLVWAREQHMMSWFALEDRTRAILGNMSLDDETDAEWAVNNKVEEIKDTPGCWIDKWWHQPYYVEVWLEKQALEGVFLTVTRVEEVVLMPCKGYPSATFLKEAADRIRTAKNTDREIVVLYFGDWDPSGKDIEEYSNGKMWMHGAKVDHFKRIAITQDQIEEYQCPPAPAKRSDSRAAAFIAQYGDEAVELDALDPPVLQHIVKENVQEWFDEDIATERDEHLAELEESMEEDYRTAMVPAMRKLADKWEDEDDA